MSTRSHRDHTAGKNLTQQGIALDMASELSNDRWGATPDPGLAPMLAHVCGPRRAPGVLAQLS